ncbi:glutaredoxin family protein [uncultured Thiohalocapsa sp.]|uniref:glutaredoxin family protein n=1 Tax=uncultured Thiohalocapsa sp. TaxID=768990 RepID=UPI0025F4A705|nr:glutaredoxin family protein [uncultured Thiohalocapsa sp.]
MPAKRVVLYSAGNCPHCKRAKAFLQRQGIAYREMDITRNPRARKALERLGARGVPTLLIGDARLDGFDEQRFWRLYGKGGGSG